MEGAEETVADRNREGERKESERAGEVGGLRLHRQRPRHGVERDGGELTRVCKCM